MDALCLPVVAITVLNAETQTVTIDNANLASKRL
jgi:hypothetical protein